MSIHPFSDRDKELMKTKLVDLLTEIVLQDRKSNVFLELKESIESCLQHEENKNEETVNYHYVEIGPHQFSMEIHKSDSCSIFAFIIGKSNVLQFSRLCTKYKVALILYLFWPISFLVMLLIFYEALDKKYSYACILGLLSPMYAIFWSNWFLIRMTITSASAIAPVLCTMVSLFTLMSLVEYDERSILSLYLCISSLAAIFDDAASHHNDATTAGSHTFRVKALGAMSFFISIAGCVLIAAGVKFDYFSTTFVSKPIGSSASLASFTTGSIYVSSATVQAALSVKQLYFYFRHPDCLVMNQVPLLRVTRGKYVDDANASDGGHKIFKKEISKSFHHSSSSVKRLTSGR